VCVASALAVAWPIGATVAGACLPSYDFGTADASAPVADAGIDAPAPLDDARADTSADAVSVSPPDAGDAGAMDAGDAGAMDAASDAGDAGAMDAALALDPGFPIAADVDSTTGNALSTPVFAIPGPNRLLVAVLVWGSDEGSNQAPLTIASDGGLAWTQQTFATFQDAGNSAPSPGVSGDTIWTSWADAPVQGVTVTATRTGTAPIVLTLGVYSFANASPALGATAQYGEQGSGEVLLSTIQATRAGSIIVGGYHAGCANQHVLPQGNTVWDVTDNYADAPCGHFNATGRLIGLVPDAGPITTGQASYTGPYSATTTVEVLPAP
jgi:hypothetical protein